MDSVGIRIQAAGSRMFHMVGQYLGTGRSLNNNSRAPILGSEGQVVSFHDHVPPMYRVVASIQYPDSGATCMVNKISINRNSLYHITASWLDQYSVSNVGELAPANNKIFNRGVDIDACSAGNLTSYNCALLYDMAATVVNSDPGGSARNSYAEAGQVGSICLHPYLAGESSARHNGTTMNVRPANSVN